MTPSEIASALNNLYDPELGIDVVSLGLIYNIRVNGNWALVEMTMTTPNCPMGGAILDGAGQLLDLRFPDGDFNIRVVYEPPWDIRMMTDSARAALGLDREVSVR